MVKGTVSISLDDYHRLIESEVDFKTKQENIRLAAKELQVFLSFLCDQTDIDKHIKSFNDQSLTSSIEFINGRAQIKFKDVQTKN